MTNKTFDAYEYVDIIAPGAVVALWLVTEWPELRALIADNEFTIGGLGLFVILSFPGGQTAPHLGQRAARPSPG